MNQQVHAEQANHQWAFGKLIDATIFLGGLASIGLNIVFWAIAIAFAHSGLIASILSVLITLLLSFVAVVLVIRYVDVCVKHFRRYDKTSSDDDMHIAIWAGIICVFLACCIIGCLSTAGTLVGWHYILMALEVLLVGYQVWRMFLGTPS